MSYENYLALKKNAGPVTQFLIKDNGIKIFPVCMSLRKFIKDGQNYFTTLNISVDIVFNVEDYYTIGCEIIQSSHHMSHLSSHYEKRPAKLYIRHEPLYEYGNEEAFLPAVNLISIVENEKDILNHFNIAIKEFESEQNISIQKPFMAAWRKNKKEIAKVQSDNEESINWRNFFYLCKK